MRPAPERSYPRLARRARLRFDRHAARYLLLSPERGLLLNDSAASIVRACTGERSARAIAEQLAGGLAEAGGAERVATDVWELLLELERRGLVVLAEAPC